jgi:hypothetical protein
MDSVLAKDMAIEVAQIHHKSQPIRFFPVRSTKNMMAIKGIKCSICTA